MPSELRKSPHYMYRESTWEGDRREEDREDDRTRYRYREGSDRVVDRAKKSWHISDKKEHKRSASPEEMIVDEIGRLSYFFDERDMLRLEKFRYHVLDIGASP
jgi:hypothetical protein